MALSSDSAHIRRFNYNDANGRIVFNINNPRLFSDGMAYGQTHQTIGERTWKTEYSD